jgi:hypothetical protein
MTETPMTRPLVLLAVLLVLTGCTNHAAPVAQGELFVVNPDKWGFAPNDITQEPRP